MLPHCSRRKNRWSLLFLRAGLSSFGWRILALVALLAPGGAPELSGQVTDPDHLMARPLAQAARVETPPVLDGTLSDPQWQSAFPVTALVQVDPEEGVASSQRVDIRILFDESALYVGARLWDSGGVSTRLGKRDMPRGDSDWFSIALDSYHDHSTAFVFEVNPSGVIRDAVRSTAGDGSDSEDPSWDPVWEALTSRDEAGWVAEMRIPFAQLRFSRGGDQIWGLQLERVIGRRQEVAVFAFSPRSERGGVQDYAHLTGLGGIRAGSRMDVAPYLVLATERRDPASVTLGSGVDHDITVGGDVLYRLSSNFTLNATFNPDFGQVEVDPRVVNLGVYEVSFREQRPFFVEGNEIFAFGRGTRASDLIYSRRIGRAPQVLPSTLEREVPSTTRILSAAKLTGKTPSGWSLGVLEAVTAREVARFRDSNGEIGEAVAEPLTAYTLVRARRDLRGGRTSAGAIASAVNRSLSTELLESRLGSSAYALGADLIHEFADRNWVLRGAVVGSQVAGSPEALVGIQRRTNRSFQRPDAQHLEVDSTATELRGYLAALAVEKRAGRNWVGGAGVTITSPGYEVNDLGLLRRLDRRDLDLEVAYRETQPGQVLRRWRLGLRGRHEWNFAGDPIMRFGVVEGEMTTLGFWTGSLQATRRLRALDDRNTRGGPIMTRPESTTLQIRVDSDPRRPLLARANLRLLEDESEGWDVDAQLTLGIQKSTRWTLEVGPRLLRSGTPAQYVTTVLDPSYLPTFGRRYLFAPLDQTELSLETRLTYTFTPTLGLELFAQPLLSSGDYGETAALEAPRTFRFVPFGEERADLDFNIRSMQGSAVLRWDWRPGSALFVVWQQFRFDESGEGDFAFARDRRALLTAPTDNRFILKGSYWFSP